MLTQELINKVIYTNTDILNAIADKLSVSNVFLLEFLNNSIPSVHTDKHANTCVYYVDGGSRGNPGIAGCGIVKITSETKVAFYRYIGYATNNIAEYSALEFALEDAVVSGNTDVEVYTDSELMANQINGIYKVKNDQLRLKYDSILSYVKKLNSFKISHVLRAQNKEADTFANMAMDLKKNGKTELTVAL